METSSADTGSSSTRSFGLEDEGPGDADPLALATGELVGVAVGVVGLEPDQLEHLRHAAVDGFPVAEAVDVQRLGDGFPDRQAGVERGEGILEDDLNVAAHVAQGATLDLGQLGAVEADGARCRHDQLQHAASRGRFAAAGLAHEPEGLARRDAEADTAHRVHDADLVADEGAAAQREVLDQVFDLEQGLGSAGRRRVRAELGDGHDPTTLSTTPSEKTPP